MNKLYHIIKIPVIILLIFLAYQLLDSGKKIQKINNYNAYQRDASRGIFNVNEWRCKLIGVVKYKIEKTDFKKLSKLITQEIINYYNNDTKQIREQYILTYDSKKSFMGNMGAVASKSYKKVLTKGIDFALKKGVKFINKKVAKNNKKLQEIVSQKTSQFIMDSLKGGEDARSFNNDCKPKEIILKSTVEIKKDQDNFFLIWWLSFLVILTIISLLYYKQVAPQSPKGEVNLRRWLLVDVSILAIILLVLGIMLPMMEINATLLDFKMTLLDQKILFTDQSLYFRSKSIYDIVTILLPVNPMIGIAVMVFSVVLPSIKLIATFILVFSKKPAKYLKWIITNLGKWSMADVFLIAIFLANLSFQNILSDQLQPLSQNNTAEMAVNTSHSSIQIGFYFFLGYVILSMIIAKLTIKHIKEGK